MSGSTVTVTRPVSFVSTNCNKSAAFTEPATQIMKNIRGPAILWHLPCADPEHSCEYQHCLLLSTCFLLIVYCHILVILTWYFNLYFTWFYRGILHAVHQDIIHLRKILFLLFTQKLDQSFLKLQTQMPTLLYLYAFFMYFLAFNLLHLYTCFYTMFLSFLHNLLVYDKSLILLLVLLVIGVVYDFLMTFNVFDGLMMVVWTTETGNHFNNIVV
jgi:hypothetical protein